MTLIRAASLAIALLATIAAVRWTRAHPYPIWWDEASYFNQVFDDRRAFLDGGVVAGLKSLLFADNLRPPAYRAVVAPVAAVMQPSLALLRTVAFCVTVAAFVLLWRACRAVASPSSSLLATMLVVAIPEILSTGAWFGTEYPLIFAIALLLYSLIRNAPAGVAAAVALGLLSKTSFLIAGGPVLLVAMIVARNGKEATRLFFASACGAVVAAGWWCWDPLSPLEFAQFARSFERIALDHHLSLRGLAQKFAASAASLGPGVVIAAILLGVGTLRRRERLSSDARRACVLAAATLMPLMILSMLSSTFIPRHFAPVLLALGIPAAILLDRAGSPIRLGVASLAVLQVLWMAVTPLRFLPRADQTDWSRLRALVRTQTPSIAMLGGWPSLSPPEVRYGWTRHGQDASAVWLWRAEERRIDWPGIMEQALASDAVLVVPPEAATHPELKAYERADNRHNAQLMQQLQASGVFAEPVAMRIGTDTKIDVLVFVRRSRV